MKKAGIILALVTAFLTLGCGRYYSSIANTTLTRGVSARETLHASPSRPMPAAMSVNFEDSAVERRTRQTDFHSASNPSTIPETAFPDTLERRLVRSAFISTRVDNLDAATAFVTNLMREHGAYAASTSTHENSRHYSLRVPSHHYDVFLAKLNDMGRLIQRTENTVDVTLQYFDLEGRLESQRELLRTFQAHLGRASTFDEILSVEARIADLQRDLEFTGTQLRHLANRVEYAAIDLSLLGPVAASINQGLTFGERSRQLVGNFSGFFSTVGIILIGIIIYGIPSLLILTLLLWLLFGRIGLLRRLFSLVMNK